MTNLFEKASRLQRRINGDKTEYDLRQYEKTLEEINKLDEGFSKKSNAELEENSQELKSSAKDGCKTEALIAPAFALVRETIRRHLSMNAYDEQLIAGLAMCNGRIVDMKTGEGKTLAAIFTVYVAALTGEGVQVLTFNDYLARRDAEWASVVFDVLGLSTAFIQQAMSKAQRRKAYNSDICYLTAREFGFDYLRDGLCYESTERVQREFHFVLVDEADSILVDEARSPLVIANSSGDEGVDLIRIAQVIKTLNSAKHLSYDEYKRNISFSEAGIDLLEEKLRCENLFDSTNSDLITRLHYAAHAQYILSRNVDYIVTDKQIKLVDEFTGRAAEKRRWADGLHDAVEAKENVVGKHKASVLSLISYQELFQLIPTVAGMTGTALQSAEEFQRFYNLVTVAIPTHKPCIREDLADRIFLTRENKNEAIAVEIAEVHSSRRPVLVGTASVAESSQLASLLTRRNIPFQLLNALNDTEEARIIAQAGCLGAVTISTNMAGRGTDIVLAGDNQLEKGKVEALGGLYVIGTNRHESERIDSQLRGRSGRQGDPGSSCFFISLEDSLCEKYQLNRLVNEKLLNKIELGRVDGEIQGSIIINLISHIQRVIEGENLEIKKTLSKYSKFKEKQRLHLRNQRDDYLIDPNLAFLFFESRCRQHFQHLSKSWSANKLQQVCSSIILFFLDKSWEEQIADMSDLESCISLRTMGGRQPFIEFQKEANSWFIEQLQSIEGNAVELFNSLEVGASLETLAERGIGAPSSTWTYQTGDAMFDDMRDTLLTQPGLAAGLFYQAMPLFLLALWVEKRKRNSRRHG